LGCAPIGAIGIWKRSTKQRASGLGDRKQGDRIAFDVVQDTSGKSKATKLRLYENHLAQPART
jgi:hypothetical protein